MRGSRVSSLSIVLESSGQSVIPLVLKVNQGQSLMKWSKFFQPAIAATAILFSSVSISQEVVTHKKLAADFYPGEGTSVVILLHGTLAHNRMEIIATISELLSDDYGSTGQGFTKSIISTCSSPRTATQRKCTLTIDASAA